MTQKLVLKSPHVFIHFNSLAGVSVEAKWHIAKVVEGGYVEVDCPHLEWRARGGRCVPNETDVMMYKEKVCRWCRTHHQQCLDLLLPPPPPSASPPPPSAPLPPGAIPPELEDTYLMMDLPIFEKVRTALEESVAGALLLLTTRELAELAVKLAGRYAKQQEENRP